MTLAEARDYWELSDQEMSRIWRLLLGKEQGTRNGLIWYLADDVETAVLEVRKPAPPRWERPGRF